MKLELNNEYFDLTKTIQRAFETLSYYSSQKKIQPIMIIDEEARPFFENIKGDESRYS